MKTRAKIMESALDVFSEKGFSGASLTEISSRVGVTKGALYWHFRNKDDLLLQLVEELCRRGEEDVKNAFRSDNPAEMMRSYYKEAFEHVAADSRHKKIYKIIQKQDELPEEIQKSIRQTMKNYIESEKAMVEEAFRKGQERGSIRKDISPAAAAEVVSSTFHGLGVLHMSGILSKEFPQYINILFDAFDKEFRAGLKR